MERGREGEREGGRERERKRESVCNVLILVFSLISFTQKKSNVCFLDLTFTVFFCSSYLTAQTFETICFLKYFDAGV